MPTATDAIEALATQEYKYGFVTEVETESVPVVFEPPWQKSMMSEAAKLQLNMW